MTVPAFVNDDLDRLGIEVPEAMLAQLGAYLDHLLEVNRSMNLTAVRERDAAWRRLIIDSLTVLPWLEDVPEGGRLIDVGTGGGLPGVPLAITRPDLDVTLADATGKKVRFLDDTIDRLGLDRDRVRAVQARAEELGQRKEHRAGYDVAVSRAVGPLGIVLELTLPLVRVGGRSLAMKGPRVEAELRDCGDALEVLGGGEVRVADAYPRGPEGFENDLVIVEVEKVAATPRRYPRPPGVPKAEPL